MTVSTIDLPKIAKTPFIKNFDVVVTLLPETRLSDDEFFEFCQANDNKRIERTADGEIIIKMPTGFLTSDRNAEVTMQLRVWAKQNKLGVATDSNGGFILPNGATRAPDAAWILKSRLDELDEKSLDKFLPLCPDFVIELRSSSDNLTELREKMIEYVENGVKLGWLIDRKNKRVFIYRANCEVEILENPDKVSGEDVLKNFELGLSEIW